MPKKRFKHFKLGLCLFDDQKLKICKCEDDYIGKYCHISTNRESKERFRIILFIMLIIGFLIILIIFISVFISHRISGKKFVFNEYLVSKFTNKYVYYIYRLSVHSKSLPRIKKYDIEAKDINRIENLVDM